MTEVHWYLFGKGGIHSLYVCLTLKHGLHALCSNLAAPLSKFALPASNIEICITKFKQALARVTVTLAKFVTPISKFELLPVKFERTLVRIAKVNAMFETPVTNFAALISGFEMPPARFDFIRNETRTKLLS